MFLIVRDHIPLKEGLRHFTEENLLLNRAAVRDHIPLKEGLRRSLQSRIVFFLGPRPYSIKRRIKTVQLYTLLELGKSSETIFH